MKPLLLDLNVILDVILDRRPGADAAAALWAAIEGGHGRGLIPAHSSPWCNSGCIRPAMHPR